MAKYLGKDMSINRNTGNYASPAWAFLRAAKDIKLNLEAIEFDTSDRGSDGDTTTPSRYKCSVDFDAIWDGGTGLTALRTAFLAGSSIELAVLDQTATNSGWGVRGEWAVTAFPLDMPLNDGQKLKIQLQLHGQYTNAPAFYTDATSSAGTAETAGTKKKGKDAVVCNSSGTAMTVIRDFKFSVEPAALFNADDRASLFELVIPTRRKYMAELNAIWQPGNTHLAAFKTAFLNRTAIELFMLDGPYATSGSWGLHGDWMVSKFPIDAKLNAGQDIKIELKPHGAYSTAVTEYTVS